MVRFQTLIPIWWKVAVMFLLYLVAIAWHSLHPIASVLSGHLNHPLTPFVDENSIDSNFYRAKSFGDVHSQPKAFFSSPLSLCEAIQNLDLQHITCFALPSENAENHGKNYSLIEVAQILPLQAPVSSKNEALVLVLPNIGSGGVNKGGIFMSFLEHLAQRPWLAKTLLIVSTTGETTQQSLNLHETVDNFLNHFLGTSANANAHVLPRECAGSVIRQLLVLDSINSPSVESLTPYILISPTGNRGVMPNMDLYSVAYKVFCHTFSARMVRSYPIAIEERVRTWKLLFRQTFPKEWIVGPITHWFDSMMEWIAWEISLATIAADSPRAPHASALNRGIDSLTVQAVNLVSNEIQKENSNREEQDRLLTFLKSAEMVLHSFSNAHERLHHNTALYAIPKKNGNAFLKHEEFLIPNILLLVPLIIRAVTLVLSFRKTPAVFDASAVSTALQLSIGGTFLIAGGIELAEHMMTPFSREIKPSIPIVQCQKVAVGLCYFILGVYLWRSRRRPTSQRLASSESVQLAACLLALYLQISIAFGNVALAFPSALFWTPQIAFFSFATLPNQQSSTTKKIFNLFLSLTFLSLTSPFLWVVPNVFAQFTVYLKYVYIPLHLITCTLRLF